MKVTFLGTGTSTGVPQIGCRCEVCTSNDPRDKRFRTSVLIEEAHTCMLIDCGPDFRTQIMQNYRDKLDAVLITHEHFDHVGGLDDLRPYCYPDGLDIYAEQYVVDHIKQRIPYCFAEHPYPGVPQFHMHEISLSPFNVGSLSIVPIRIMHYLLPIVGYRIGNMAYITDMKTIPEEEYEKLKGLDVLIINALGWREHRSHQNIPQALTQIACIAPKEAYLIHMSHNAGLHGETMQKLPSNVHLAYDNLVINID